jgi:hypothetical protein
VSLSRRKVAVILSVLVSFVDEFELSLADTV